MSETTCPGCGWEIEPDVCHCGSSKFWHNPYELGHTFVPMGCTCGYEDADQRKKF
jgi:hypothetical protein